jgi:hypothetical protein
MHRDVDLAGDVLYEQCAAKQLFTDWLALEEARDLRAGLPHKRPLDVGNTHGERPSARECLEVCNSA